jgi:hypothetical protein
MANNDSGSHAPPATGPYGYNGFVPGRQYEDPVYGSLVQRVTSDHGRDDVYARNMCWSADGRRYVHRTQRVAGKTDAWDVIDVATGTVTHSGVPFGGIAADGGFDAVDPDVLWILTGREIRKVTLQEGGRWTVGGYFEAPGELGELGGSINWLDASGRTMLVRWGSEPSVYVYDRERLHEPYANPIDSRPYVGTGSYLGLSPDGRYVVGWDSRPVGMARVGRGVSWAIDHEARAVASAPVGFWSLCGDHGAFLTATDGKTYMVTHDCYSHAALWRVSVDNDAEGLNDSEQHALPGNRLLIPWSTWSDFGHISTVARGAWRDWVFVSTEDATDLVGGPVDPWHPYRQEILAVQVLTGEVRRLAHHRSRSLGEDYYAQPRVSCAWEGQVVGFPSNMNQPGVVDIFCIPFEPVTPAPTPDLPIELTLSGTRYVGTVRAEP